MDNIINLQEHKQFLEYVEARRTLLFSFLELFNSMFGQPNNYLIEKFDEREINSLANCTGFKTENNPDRVQINIVSQLDPSLNPFAVLIAERCTLMSIMPTPVSDHLINWIENYLVGHEEDVVISFHLVAFLIRVAIDSGNVIVAEQSDDILSIRRYSEKFESMITLTIYPQELRKEGIVVKNKK